MTNRREVIIVALTLVCALAVVAALTERVVAYSTLISASIGLGMALAYAPHLTKARVYLVLVPTFLLLIWLWASAANLQAEAGPPLIVLGFPLQTTLFAWVIWPLGAVMCALHVFCFDDLLLPRSTVGKIRAEHGPSSSDSDGR